MTPLPEETARIVAIKALGWLAANDDLLPVFLGSTGASEADLKTRIDEPEFLASVLDFLLIDDAWIESFCLANDYTPDYPLRARAGLPGGAEVNWT